MAEDAAELNPPKLLRRLPLLLTLGRRVGVNQPLTGDFGLLVSAGILLMAFLSLLGLLPKILFRAFDKDLRVLPDIEPEDLSFMASPAKDDVVEEVSPADER